MIDAVTKPKTKVKTKTERPRLHKVILINDDFTPREFVVTVLKAEFRMTEDQAHKVMITAHQRGVCVVAVFTKDVAETKATRATDAGRGAAHLQRCSAEPDLRTLRIPHGPRISSAALRVARCAIPGALRSIRGT